ncbi:MAG TPA: S-methyl-5-thioribose-1-phosphate isomerase [Lachnospiraceae bacterium]|jgi:methylthioribose-1-phosphate isomerase|nr:S-methyl-5-thioribose-1-phosphate isomerase [Lachnospiraceae bacterium]
MEKAKSILDYETVELLDNEDAIQIIDQTLLPGETKLIKLYTAKEIWDAIYLLQVRGAPAIGVTAGFGIYLLTKLVPVPDDTPENHDRNFTLLHEAFEKNKEYLASSRPTAVNLSWALNRMEKLFLTLGEDRSLTMAQIKERLREEAQTIKREDIEVCRRIGEYGLTLVKPGDGLMTHCNAGQLACCKYGTATAPMYLGQERGYHFHVYCDETRPLLQGARLTAYELHSAGIEVTLECDDMSSSLMRQGKINAVFVGCDRVAANGDAANKIGTSVDAIVAARYHVPFYVCAPTSTIDMSLKSGAQIPIEMRKPEEVTTMWYEKRMAPEGIDVYNPAFDVTDNELIAGIVTEYGIARAPYTESLKAIFEEKKNHPIQV